MIGSGSDLFLKLETMDTDNESESRGNYSFANRVPAGRATVTVAAKLWSVSLGTPTESLYLCI